MLHTVNVMHVSLKDVICVPLVAMTEYVVGGADHSFVQVIKWLDYSSEVRKDEGHLSSPHRVINLNYLLQTSPTNFNEV